MASIEKRWPVVIGSVIGISRVGTLVRCTTASVVSKVVRHRLAQRVRSHKLKAIRQPLAGAHLERMILTLCPRVCDASLGHIGVEVIERTAVLSCYPEVRIARTWQRLVDVAGSNQMLGPMSHITGRQRCV